MNKLTSATASNNDSGKTTLTWVRQSVNTYFSFSLGEASYKEGFVTTTHKEGFVTTTHKGGLLQPPTKEDVINVL